MIEPTLQTLSEPLLNQSGLNSNELSSKSSTSIEATISIGVNVSNDQTKSKNITFILIYSILIFAGRSTWNQSVFAAFIFLLKDSDPKYVGLLNGIMGASQLLISFPSGIFADKYRRDSVLKIASGVGIVASASTIIASIKLSFTGLAISLALWGIYWGISKPTISALFADSMKDGERSRYFTQRMIAQFCGSTAGPIVSLVMFSIIGDDWNVRECAIIMCVGNCLCIPAALLLCLLSDDNCMSESSDEGEESATESVAILDRIFTDAINDVSDRPEATESSSESINSRDTDSNEVVREDFDTYRASNRFWSIPETKVMPALVAAADFMSALASGLSSPYLPIFLLSNLELKPSQVQIIYIISTASLAIGSKVAHHGGKKLGRLLFTLISKWIGVSLMVAMIISYQSNISQTVVCALFILRMVFINSCAALTKSVLMDAVPKNERAKWSSLESVNVFNWSGSAALGGILVSMDGIIFNFFATAAFQLVATLPLAVLIFRDQTRNRDR